jgi:sterol desaturase/sphingolipid hydroxylase (fatty acid hydroxylase superfamily)
MPSLVAALSFWSPLVVLAVALLSYGLHRVAKAPHPMTVKETLANVSNFVIWKFVFFTVGAGVQIWILSKIEGYVPWKFSQGWYTLPAALLVVDFSYYWKHRMEHEVSFLWAQHHVHHSSPEFNLSTSLRLPWIGSYFVWPFFIPAIFLGFGAVEVIAAYQLLLAYQYFVHTEFVRKLGVLEYVINTPSNHRVHHGRNERYLDKNYGGILIIWDRLFGSYVAEESPVDYGTVHPLNSYNPLKINFFPWLDFFRALKKIPTLRMRLKGAFLSPTELEKLSNRSYKDAA